MTNPTSNYGWIMPSPVDLVTDLPADFEVFGQAVDTSLADLKGGTTGQVLSKATNADMDFVWTSANPGDITGVTATSPLTGGGTSGDVTIGILSGTTSNLGAVQLSTSTSSTSTSLAATASAVKSAYDLASSAPIPNPILNSAFNVWQRGTTGTANTFAAGGGYNADRWQNYSVNALTISRQATNDSTNLANIQYCARVQRNAGQTSTSLIYHAQTLESLNSIPYAGKTVTISFYARAGANYSAASNALTFELGTGTGNDESIFGFTGRLTPISLSSTLTTTWQRFTATGTVSSTAKQLGVAFVYTPTGTAGANDYFETTGVQIDVGSVALPFRADGSTYALELAACQRYYFRTTSGVDYGTVGFGGIGATTTAGAGFLKYPVTMRTNPTSIDYSTLAVNDTATITAITSVTANKATPDILDFTWNCASGITQFRPYKIITNNSSAGYLGVSAEL